VSAASILLVDDDPAIVSVLGALLRQADYEVRTASRGEQALAMLEERVPTLVLSDVRMPGLGGFGLLDALRARRPGLPVVLLTAFGDVDLAMEAVRRGARDFLTKPVKREAVLAAIARALPRSAMVDTSLVCEGDAMRGLRSALTRVAASDANVWIAGETGTGKSRAARHLHHLGRPDTPRVELSCGAIPESLFEAELFGVAEAAFTGAGRGRPGALERCGRGTLLLDDVDGLSPHAQAALLRVLSQGEYRRVGGVEELHFAGRVVATSARELAQVRADGDLRQDLYYRLATFAVRMPPLRERPEDLPELVRLFLTRLARECSAPTPVVNAQALLELRAHAWPGNVRELSAIATRLWLDRPGEITPDHVRRALHGVLGRPDEASSDASGEARVRAALTTPQGNKSEAARLLGISRGTLYKRLRELQLDVEA